MYAIIRINSSSHKRTERSSSDLESSSNSSDFKSFRTSSDSDSFNRLAGGFSVLVSVSGFICSLARDNAGELQ